MMRQHFLFLWLLILLTVQGCAPSPYQTTTPYPSTQTPQPTDERDISQPGSTEPSEQPTGQTKSPLISDISQQADQQMRNRQLQAVLPRKMPLSGRNWPTFDCDNTCTNKPYRWLQNPTVLPVVKLP